MSEFRLTKEQKQREREIVADKFYDEIVRIRREYDGRMARNEIVRIRREYDGRMARINAVPSWNCDAVPTTEK